MSGAALNKMAKIEPATTPEKHSTFRRTANATTPVTQHKRAAANSNAEPIEPEAKKPKIESPEPELNFPVFSAQLQDYVPIGTKLKTLSEEEQWEYGTYENFYSLMKESVPKQIASKLKHCGRSVPDLLRKWRADEAAGMTTEDMAKKYYYESKDGISRKISIQIEKAIRIAIGGTGPSRSANKRLDGESMESAAKKPKIKFTEPEVVVPFNPYLGPLPSHKVADALGKSSSESTEDLLEKWREDKLAGMTDNHMIEKYKWESRGNWDLPVFIPTATSRSILQPLRSKPIPKSRRYKSVSSPTFEQWIESLDKPAVRFEAGPKGQLPTKGNGYSYGSQGQSHRDLPTKPPIMNNPYNHGPQKQGGFQAGQPAQYQSMNNAYGNGPQLQVGVQAGPSTGSQWQGGSYASQPAQFQSMNSGNGHGNGPQLQVGVQAGPSTGSQWQGGSYASQPAQFQGINSGNGHGTQWPGNSNTVQPTQFPVVNNGNLPQGGTWFRVMTPVWTWVPNAPPIQTTLATNTSGNNVSNPAATHVSNMTGPRGPRTDNANVDHRLPNRASSNNDAEIKKEPISSEERVIREERNVHGEIGQRRRN